MTSPATKTSFLIARRFIFSAKKVKIINLITGISILGVIVGVMTLTVVMSVLNGFQDLARQLFLTIDSDVQLIAAKGNSVEVPDSLLNQVSRMNGVASAYRFVEGKTVFISDKNSGVIVLKGIDPAAYTALSPMLRLEGRPLKDREAAVGAALAERFQLFDGSDVRLLGPKLIEQGLAAIENPLALKMPEAPTFKVTNLFTTHRIYDEGYVLTTIGKAQSVFQLAPGRVTGIDIRVAGVTDEEMKFRLQEWVKSKSLEKTYAVTSLSDKYRELFRVMQMEKWGSFAVLMLVVIVASLSLIGSLTMTAIEKKRDLYFLRCIGMTEKELRRIFLFESALVAGIGTVVGVLLGYGLCWAQLNYGIVKLPGAGAFIIDSYPVKIVWSDYISVAVGTMVVCLLAGFYPAKKATLMAEERQQTP